MKERKEARCLGRWWLFESTRRTDHVAAKRVCDGEVGEGKCPLFDACQATAEDFLRSQWRGGLHGTWAGRLYGAHLKKEPA